MRTTIRLLVRQQRFEIVTVVLLSAIVAGGAAFIAWRLGAVGVPRDCFTAPTMTDACQRALDEFNGLDQRFTAWIFVAVTALPVVAGLLLGVPLVGRELEAGTAPLAWTLGPSRRPWLVVRAGILAAGLTAVLSVPAMASEILQSARQPLLDTGASFAAIESRGALVVAAGLVTFAVSALAGAVLGRQLPGLVVATILAVVAILGVTLAVGPGSAWARPMASWQSQDRVSVGAAAQGAVFLDVAYRDRATGALYPPHIEGLPDVAIDASGNPDLEQAEREYEAVHLTLPGSAYATIATAMGVAYGAVALIALAAALIVVDRRHAA